MALTQEKIDETYAEFRKRIDEIGARQECYGELVDAADDARRKAHSLTDTVIDEVNEMAKSLEELAEKISEKAQEAVRRAWNDADEYNQDLHAFEDEITKGEER